jgi:hypothetical protein
MFVDSIKNYQPYMRGGGDGHLKIEKKKKIFGRLINPIKNLSRNL